MVTIETSEKRSRLVQIPKSTMSSSPDGFKKMTDKAKAADLQASFYERGHRMAHDAEQGHIAAINDELAQFRKQKTTSPEKYNALITSIQSANIVHLDEDRRNLNSKQVSALTVPKLILMDSKDDKDTLPDHIGMSILPDGTRTAAAEPKAEKSQQAERAEEAARVYQRMKETGSYGPSYGVGDGPANAAFEHVLNMKKQ